MYNFCDLIPNDQHYKQILKCKQLTKYKTDNNYNHYDGFDADENTDDSISGIYKDNDTIKGLSSMGCELKSNISEDYCFVTLLDHQMIGNLSDKRISCLLLRFFMYNEMVNKYSLKIEYHIFIFFLKNQDQ